MPTSEEDTVGLLDVIAACGTEPIVAGGWGVDALVGRQTREHRDLDVLVPDPDVEHVIETLTGAGFEVTTDWLPVRIELSDYAEDRHVDVHPVHDDGSGGWWQHGLDDVRYSHPASALTQGVIGGRPVRCLTAAAQLRLHDGYPHRAEDVHDVALLRQLRA